MGLRLAARCASPWPVGNRVALPANLSHCSRTPVFELEPVLFLTSAFTRRCGPCGIAWADGEGQKLRPLPSLGWRPQVSPGETPADSHNKLLCFALSGQHMHNGIMCIRTAASRFLLRLGFCELALAAESLASLTIQALGVGLLRAAQRDLDGGLLRQCE